MPLSKKKFREIVFQLLYSRDVSVAEPDDLIPFMMQEMSVTRANMRAANAEMEKVLKHLTEIDQMIAEAVKEYTFDQIHRVERNILRLGLYEIFFCDTIPPKVAITESLRLCRKFSTPESAKFVNAILDHAYKAAYPPQEGDEDKMQIYFGDQNDPKR